MSKNSLSDESYFQSRVAELAGQIDDRLISLIKSEVQIPNLHDGMLYSMGLDVEDRKIRGKRIRPVLGLLTAEALGTSVEKAMAFACAIELLHNFALVHDDIEDGDTTRRDRPCVYIQYGLAHGINIGDYLLSKVYRAILLDQENPPEIREKLHHLLSETMEHIFVGQSLDISARRSRSFTMADYERLVDQKTGSYLAAPMIGGAIVSGASDEDIDSLKAFGKALGPMFQIKDDMIDLTSGKGRGTIGNDIKEGKRSFLVASVVEKSTTMEAEKLYDILDRKRDQTDEEDVRWAIDLFNKYGVLHEAQERCDSLLSEGLNAISTLPERLRRILEVAAEVLARRQN